MSDIILKPNDWSRLGTIMGTVWVEHVENLPDGLAYYNARRDFSDNLSASEDHFRELAYGVAETFCDDAFKAETGLECTMSNEERMRLSSFPLWVYVAAWIYHMEVE